MPLIYPAIFTPYENDSGYSVIVPDLENCATEGDSLSDAISMAEAAACAKILELEEKGIAIPSSSDMSDFELDDNETIHMLRLNLAQYIQNIPARANAKILPIPNFFPLDIRSTKK